MKPLKETKVGEWLKNNLPEVADTVANILPENGALGIVKNILQKKLESNQINMEQLNEALTHIYDLENENATLALQDIANARDMNTNIQQSEKASWWSKNMAYMIDAFVMLVWGLCTILLVLKVLKIIQIAPGAQLSDVLGIYVGVCGMATVIIQFHRGSSTASKTKDELINKLINKQ